MADPGADKIEYGQLMHRAMRGLIKTVLSDVADGGLPGDHHFFVTFDTTAPGVQVAPWLRDRYPEEMTIVIQHWFDGLVVDDEGFDITLNFGDQPEALRVPFDAIVTFVDPSVEFGLRFEARTEGGISVADSAGDPDDAAQPEGTLEALPPPGPAADSATDKTGEKDTPEGDAQVVSLDSFRKGP